LRLKQNKSQHTAASIKRMCSYQQTPKAHPAKAAKLATCSTPLT